MQCYIMPGPGEEVTARAVSVGLGPDFSLKAYVLIVSKRRDRTSDLAIYTPTLAAAEAIAAAINAAFAKPAEAEKAA